jgi:hypothetical protein
MPVFPMWLSLCVFFLPVLQLVVSPAYITSLSVLSIMEQYTL